MSISENTKLISLDYWSTIVDASVNGAARRKSRNTKILEAAQQQGVFVDDELIRSAFSEADKVFHHFWEKEHRTPSTRHLTEVVFEDLGIHLFDEELDAITTVFERSLLAGPPALSPGIEAFLERHGAQFEFAIISDTMFSPGYVIKEYLESKGIAKYFSYYAFSDELGKSKPDIEVFKQIRNQFGLEPSECIHIGDLLRTDVNGANNAGWTSILYTGIRTDDYPGIEANHICSSWDKVSEVLLS